MFTSISVCLFVFVSCFNRFYFAVIWWIKMRVYCVLERRGKSIGSVRLEYSFGLEWSLSYPRLHNALLWCSHVNLRLNFLNSLSNICTDTNTTKWLRITFVISVVQRTGRRETWTANQAITRESALSCSSFLIADTSVSDRHQRSEGPERLLPEGCCTSSLFGG